MLVLNGSKCSVSWFTISIFFSQPKMTSNKFNFTTYFILKANYQIQQKYNCLQKNPGRGNKINKKFSVKKKAEDCSDIENGHKKIKKGDKIIKS